MIKETKHRRLTLFSLIILLTALLCFVVLDLSIQKKINAALVNSADIATTQKQPYISIEEHRITLHEKDGKYYAFMPAAYRNTEFEPKISNRIDPSSIIWMYSEHIPSVFIDTDSGSSDQVNSNKEIRETGMITVLNADGTIGLRQPLEYIKGRGNTSFTEFEKKSYQIKLKKSAPFLGMDSDKKWILISNSCDSTLLRNALARNLANHLGLAQSKEGAFADLYLNGEYIGNYYIVEKIEIGKNRLSITDLEKETQHINRKDDFSSYETAWTDTTKAKQIPKDPKDITGGYIIERDFDNRFLTEVEENGSYFITQGKECFIVRSPEYTSQNQIAYINNYIQSVENAILSQNGTDPNTGKAFQDLIDMDSFVRKYLLEEITANYDGGVASSYFYKDSDQIDGKLYAGPVWDYDVSFGNSPAYLGYIPTSPKRLSKLASHVDSSVWFHNLYKKPEFYQQVISCYQEQISNYLPVLAQEILPELDDLTASSQAMDQVRWEQEYIKNGYHNDRDTEIDFLAEFINGRKDFLDKAWIEQIPVHRITLLTDGVLYGDFYVFEGETLPELPKVELEGMQFKGWVLAEDGQPPNFNQPVRSDMVFHAVIE